MHAASIAVLLAALAVAGPAAAQSIWRCGSSYSQEPCPGGTTLPDQPLPGPADRSQAAAAAARDQRLADAMERQRLQREAQAQASPQLYVAAPAPSTELEPYRTPEQRATRRLDMFTATVPGSGRKHKEARPPAKAPAHQPAATGRKPAREARDTPASRLHKPTRGT